MPETLTLSAYLAQRGKKAKALKRGEAEAFGIPWPLQAGWPWRYGAMEITPEMIEDSHARIRASKQAARRKPEPSSSIQAVTQLPMALSSAKGLFSGFVRRQARRYQARTPAPWK